MFHSLFKYKNEDDQIVSFKQIILIDFIALTSLFSLLYATVSAVIHFEPGICAMLSNFSLFLITLLLYIKHKISYRLAAHLYISNACLVAILVCTYFSGGHMSPVLPWFILVPVISLLLLGGNKETLVWLSISLSLILAFFIAGMNGHQFPLKYDTSFLELFSLICFFGLAGIVFWVTMVFEKEKDKAMLTVQMRNNEITDSINYAKRLQDAILPTSKQVLEHFPKSFIYYRPKDIVAGDFYWMEELNECVYFAVADCTGHGVPGAMVSVVCSSVLTKSLLEEKIEDPAQILDRSRDLIIERFTRTEERIKDGMDISIIRWNKATNEICWAGANNSIFLIKKNSNEVDILKPDKQPVAAYVNPRPFTSHEFKIAEGDQMFLFTDGYIDQFGGERGKKYMSKRFIEHLLKIRHEPTQKMKEAINDEFVTWMADLEQIDDVCVFGFEV